MQNKFRVFLLGDFHIMTKKGETKCSNTEDQIDNFVIQAMQRTAQSNAKYANDLQCPPAFIALVLRDIAKIFKVNEITAEKNLSLLLNHFRFVY